MKNEVAPVKNVVNLVTIGEALRSRDPGVPGIGIIAGNTGDGKTTAAAWWRNQVDAVFVRAVAVWTPSSMLGAIMRELAMEPRGTCAERVDAIVQKLAEEDRPVIIDEADYLVSSGKMLETLRDLHDLSAVPIILIGMAGFRAKITHRKQFSGRISQWVEFLPADAEDARTLCDAVCEVAVDDDLLKKLHGATGGSMRGLTVGLSRIEGFARSRGAKKVTAADWGNLPFTFADSANGRG